MTTATTKAKIAWKYPESVDARGLAVYLRRAGEKSYKLLGKFTETEITFDDLDVGEKYEWAFAYIDGDGKININDLALADATFVGADNPPPAPADFGATQSDDVVKLKWTGIKDKCRDFSYYEIRIGSAWSGSLFVAKLEAETYSHSWATAGSTTYHVSAFDKWGNHSSAVAATVVIQALQGFVADTEQDEDGGGFTGTKTACEVESGDLVTTAFGTPANTITILGNAWTFPASGPGYAEYTTAQQDMGTSRNVRVAIEISAAVEGGDDLMARNGDTFTAPPMLPPTLDDGSHIDRTDQSKYQPWGECLAAGDDSAVRIDTFIKLDSGSWLPYVPGFYYARYITFRTRFWSRWFWRRIRIPTIRFRAYKRNLKDEGTFAVGGAGPHDIDFVQPFIDVPYVTAMHSSDLNWVSVSNITASDFDAIVYDDEGNEVVTGSIYWTALGT